VHSTKEYLSIHKGFARAGGCPGPCGISPSKVTSDISINSSSRILFTNLGGKAAPGLKGPGVEIGEALGRVGKGVAAAEEAAAAAMLRGPEQRWTRAWLGPVWVSLHL
jgi:hypothetical protein